MSNKLDKDALDELFDIDSEPLAFTERSKPPVVETLDSENTKFDDEEKYFTENIKEIMDDVYGVIAAAKFLCDTNPDAETITAASSMFTSATQLLKELNKSVMQVKKQKFLKNLENMKIEARMELAKFKAENDKNKLIVGSGSTINIQQNNNLAPVSIPYCQEKIINDIIKSEKQLELDSDDVIIDSE